MRFLLTHHDDVLKLLEKYSFSKDEFDFVKKRGRINIIERSSKRFFAYLRVKETQLNSTTKQWEESTFYKIKTETKKEVIVPDWKEVYKEMENWIAELK